MPPGWFGKKAIDEEGSANPGWLNEEADGEHVAAVAGADAGENATSAHDHDETSPLIADADDEEDDYDDAMEYGNSGYGTGSAHPDDEESSTSLTSSNLHEDDAIASPSLSSSRRSSSSRPKLGTGKKKVSTRTRMNEYKAKLEERRRKMLSGLPRTIHHHQYHRGRCLPSTDTVAGSPHLLCEGSADDSAAHSPRVSDLFLSHFHMRRDGIAAPLREIEPKSSQFHFQGVQLHFRGHSGHGAGSGGSRGRIHQEEDKRSDGHGSFVVPRAFC